MQNRVKIHYEGVGDAFVLPTALPNWLARGWVLAEANPEAVAETLLSDEEESDQDVVEDTEEF